MSIRTWIMGSKKIIQAPAVPPETSDGADKIELRLDASVTARTAKVMRSPFEEDLSKLSRTPRGLSFAERSWTRDS